MQYHSDNRTRGSHCAQPRNSLARKPPVKWQHFCLRKATCYQLKWPYSKPGSVSLTAACVSLPRDTLATFLQEHTADLEWSAGPSLTHVCYSLSQASVTQCLSDGLKQLCEEAWHRANTNVVSVTGGREFAAPGTHGPESQQIFQFVWFENRMVFDIPVMNGVTV